MSRRPVLLLPVLTALFAACSASAPPSSPPEAASPGAAPAAASAEGGMYAEEQAERGRGIFRDRCSECHYSSEMRGAQFQYEWERRTVGDLYDHLVETMPEDAPGSLTPSQYIDVVAYILRLNGFAAGAAELRPEGPRLGVSLQSPSDPF